MTEISQLYINDAHANGRHSKYCSPQTCPEIAQLHATNDHSKCFPGHCSVIEKDHKDGIHLSCSSSWCENKKAVERSHSINVHTINICTYKDCPTVRSLHYDNDDHTYCTFLSCSALKEKHDKGDHTFCKGPVGCDFKYKENARNLAHDRGFHSQYCTDETCSAVANSHQTDHTLCNHRDCEIKRLSHETDHKLCSEDSTIPYRCLAAQSIDSAHRISSHSSHCNSFTCDAVRSVQANAHEKGTHSLFCNSRSCPDVAKSHAKDHKLCSRKYCDFVKSRCDSDQHDLCKWGSCPGKYHLDRQLRAFLKLDGDEL